MIGMRDQAVHVQMLARLEMQAFVIAAVGAQASGKVLHHGAEGAFARRVSTFALMPTHKGGVQLCRAYAAAICALAAFGHKLGNLVARWQGRRGRCRNHAAQYAELFERNRAVTIVQPCSLQGVTPKALAHSRAQVQHFRHIGQGRLR